MKRDVNPTVPHVAPRAVDGQRVPPRSVTIMVLHDKKFSEQGAKFAAFRFGVLFAGRVARRCMDGRFPAKCVDIQRLADIERHSSSNWNIFVGDGRPTAN